MEANNGALMTVTLIRIYSMMRRQLLSGLCKRDHYSVILLLNYQSLIFLIFTSDSRHIFDISSIYCIYATTLS